MKIGLSTSLLIMQYIYTIMLRNPEMSKLVYGITMIADVLLPNRHQAISNQHANFTAIMVR